MKKVILLLLSVFYLGCSIDNKLENEYTKQNETGEINLILKSDAEVNSKVTLLPSKGKPVSITPTNRSLYSSSYLATNVPKGNYTLIVESYKDSTLVSASLEAVEVLSFETTTVEQVVKETGNIIVRITPQMANQLDVSIIGNDRFKKQNEVLKLSASVSDYTDNLVYVWYINGISAGIGKDFTLDSSISLGYHDITVTAFSSDGKRAGNQNRLINVHKSDIDATAFITVWDTRLGDDQNSTDVILPLGYKGEYDFIVDWGDGTSNRITNYDSPDRIHSYSVPGTYEVTITGKFIGIDFPTNHLYSNRNKLTEVKQWGAVKLGRSGAYFLGCQNLDITATDFLDIEGVTDFSYAFSQCFKLTTFPKIEIRHISKVRRMAGMFSLCLNLKNIPFIELWDVSNVADMKLMFQNARLFNGDISEWDVSNVSDMNGMFSDANSFNSDLSEWDVSNVKDMSRMFDRAYSFNSNLSGWNVSNVTNMSHMFEWAESFNCGGINIYEWDWNVNKVETMDSIFKSSPLQYYQPLWIK